LRGFFFYLPLEDPVPVPPELPLPLFRDDEPSGLTELEPLPTPWLLLPPMLDPVVPCMPVVDELEPVPVAPPVIPGELVELPAEPPADPPPAPPPPPPPPCANARVELNASIAATATVVIFMHCLSS
jgi:hypothetical protein